MIESAIRMSINIDLWHRYPSSLSVTELLDQSPEQLGYTNLRVFLFISTSITGESGRPLIRFLGYLMDSLSKGARPIKDTDQPDECRHSGEDIHELISRVSTRTRNILARHLRNELSKESVLSLTSEQVSCLYGAGKLVQTEICWLKSQLDPSIQQSIDYVPISVTEPDSSNYGLCRRSRNCLLRAGIQPNDYNAIQSLSESDILSWRGAGKVVLDDIIRYQSQIALIAPQSDGAFQEESSDSLLLFFLNRCSERARTAILKSKLVGIDLLLLSRADVTRWHGSGFSIANEIVEIQSTARTLFDFTIYEHESENLELYSLVSHVNNHNPYAYVVCCSFLTEEALDVLELAGVHSLRDFLLLDRFQLATKISCGLNLANIILTIRDACIKLFSADNTNCHFDSGLSNLYSRLYDLLPSSLRPACVNLDDPLSSIQHFFSLKRKDIWYKAISFYYGLGRFQPGTLDSIATELRLSRERIRQIIRNSNSLIVDNSGFFSPILFKLFDEISSHGGLLASSEAFETLFLSSPNAKEKRSDMFLSLFQGYPIWSSLNLYVDSLSNISVSAPDPTLVPYLSTIIPTLCSAYAEERYSEDCWCISESLLMDKCWQLISSDVRYNLKSFPNASWNVAFDNLSSVLQRKDNSIVSTRLYLLRYGKLYEFIEQIYLDYPDGLHYSEVYTVAKSWRPTANITGKSLLGLIERCPNLMLWDRGVYIHASFVADCPKLISIVAAWCLDQLNNGIPYISMIGVFERFSEICTCHSIPSPHALYSILRRSTIEGLAFRRFPYVESNNSTERESILSVLEDYIRSGRGVVTDEDLRNYALNKLLIGEMMLAVHISNVPNVLNLGYGWIHLEHVSYNSKHLQELQLFVDGLLKTNDHISIDYILSKKPILCKQAGLTDARYAHAVLTSIPESRHDGNYPIIANPSEESKGRQGVISIVVEYLRSLSRPVSYLEILQHFVHERGYKERTVLTIATRSNIIRYATACVIHEDALKWSLSKQNELESLLISEYSNSLRRGCYVARLRDVLDYRYEELPSIGDLLWTDTLLADLSSRCHSIVFIGSKQDGYICKLKSEGILDLDSLIFHLLSNEPSGAAATTQIEETLVDMGVLSTSLTSSQITKFRLCQVVGHMITLKRQ